MTEAVGSDEMKQHIPQWGRGFTIAYEWDRKQGWRMSIAEVNALGELIEDMLSAGY